MLEELKGKLDFLPRAIINVSKCAAGSECIPCNFCVGSEWPEAEQDPESNMEAAS